MSICQRNSHLNTSVMVEEAENEGQIRQSTSLWRLPLMESGAIAGHSHPASKSLTRIRSLPSTPHPKTADVRVSRRCSLIAVVFGPHFECNWAYRLYIPVGNTSLLCPRRRMKQSPGASHQSMQEDLCTGMRVSSPALLLRESQENHAEEREWRRRRWLVKPLRFHRSLFFFLLPPIRAACWSLRVQLSLMTP